MNHVPAEDAAKEHKPTPLERSGLLQSFTKFGPTLFVLAVMGAGWLAVHQINTSGQTDEEEVAKEDPSTPDSLTLPEGKLNAAKFETVPAQMQAVENVRTLPGRIRYDETKHVDVKAPMDGILSEVLVTPGEQVQCGQLIAVLRSPEIGKARAEILKRLKEREIAQQMSHREHVLTQNLAQMSTMLDQGKPVDVIEDAFRDRALGAYRQDILSAYAKLQLASDLLDKVEPLVSSGSVSGRTVRERQAERQMAETQFLTARDQATFAAEQARMQADANLAEADRQLNLARQAVESLLGYEDGIAVDCTPVDLADSDHEVSDESNDALSRLEIRAPFAGSVESRAFANNERVSRSDSLIVLANTDSLYVAASIRESDWSAVSLDPGTIITVTVPALNDRVFEATVRYFGREVQTDTNSVPLIATIDNRDGLLRPGMFVRVTIPVGKARNALSVKPESIVQHENQSFVFVDQSGGTFRRVDVATGHASDEWVEVKTGLQPGQSVVTHGAFLLKSELLLQGE
ncbi:efflux RND transporter periplasmic adaptor subunit [Rhodopirellula sp. SWK7]|uniref:efflux RND transporter periplasmic adaptor subunit n=1 Tax=Rhodopirellula sp. SWK7 TaxID=595460 RepID=UPI0002BE0453|nr:efflux RND transporter periplasmic adaptor subunit [Rhodopirellula sp. SWK7]EMI40724.1 efflux transporter, RND family, MFP subunit [Rhodopirellula sp. SWK7]